MSPSKTPSNPNEELSTIINFINLSLEKISSKIVQFNVKENVLNLLFEVPENSENSELEQAIRQCQLQLKSLRIMSVKLFKKEVPQSPPKCFGMIDLSEVNVIMESALTVPKSAQIQSRVISENENKLLPISSDLGIKERVKQGDISAIQQLLDIALIHKNVKSTVRTDGRVLKIFLECEQFIDQNSVVMIVKRQIDLNCRDFEALDIEAKSQNNEVIWSEIVPCLLKSSQVKKSSISSELNTEKFEKYRKLLPFIASIFAVLVGGLIIGVAYYLTTRTQVPDVVGQQVSNAQGIIKGRNLEVQVVEKVEEDVAPGQVMKQEPTAGSSLEKGKLVTLHVSKTPTYVITGSLILVDDDIGGIDSNCYGRGGYRDIQGGMSVTIKDGSGSILSTSSTDMGSALEKYEEFILACQFEFSVEVPKAKFYSIEIGRRGELNYSLDEMKRQNWKISLSLGS